MARTRQPEVSNDVTRLITQIRAMIGKGEELPPERLLADQLKVKRHRLRLALETMRDAAELPRPIIRRNDSPVLKSDVVVQGTNALEVIELRIVLEPAIARLAAVRASPVQIAKILEAATTPQGVTRTIGDIAFHKLLADSSGNQLAASLYAFPAPRRLRPQAARAHGQRDHERAHPAARPGTPRHRGSHRRALAGRRRTGHAPALAAGAARNRRSLESAGDGLSSWPECLA